MTPAEQRLFARVQRRAADVSPELAAAILRAYQRLREEMAEAVLARAIALDVERVFERVLTQAVLDVAFLPVRERVRRSILSSVPVYTKTLPPQVAGQLGVAFDTLSPHVVDAIRALESRVITSLQSEIRETVRTAVMEGLVQGRSARSVAKGLRDVIGLGPSQRRDVEHYRTKLEQAREPFPRERIDRMVDAYRTRRIAHNAATIAGTAAKDAQKLANRLAWENAIARGLVDRGSLVRTWRGTLDDRERATHVAMEGDTAPFDLPHSNGQMVPGESEYNCRCIDVYRVVPHARAA